MAGTETQAFGALLRAYRRDANLTQEELAERAGLSTSAVKKLEQGAHHPFPDTARRLTDALGLTPADRDRLVAAASASQEGAARATAPWPGLACEDRPSLTWQPNSAAGTPAVLSHAVEDGDFAARLLADLADHGIAAWAERRDPQFGAGPPEVLRAAVRACHAVLLVASPASRASRWVGRELGLAEMYGRPVVPVWSAGEQWADCAPAALAGVPYVDARGARYPEAVVALVAAIGALTAALPGESAVAAPAAHVAPRNPYKGLRAFGEEDAGDFFGRSAFVQTLLEAVAASLAPTQAATPRLLAVVGPSGSGKSSLVRAGLISRLKAGALPGSERWVYLDPVLPGARPLEALAVALAGRDERSIHALREDLGADDARGLHLWVQKLAPRVEQRVVLVVDQLEELFTLTTDDEERRQFIDLLLTAVAEPRGPLLAIVTMRADFCDRPMAYSALGAALEARSKSVLPMNVAELREAVERPAALPDVQLVFEPGLVGDLLYEVAGRAGALPLLQFTLEQLVACRQGTALTVAAYRELGGVRGALSRQAEATYALLPSDEHRHLARALFLRLIDPGATEQDTTRRRAAKSELALPGEHETAVMREVADTFVAARLLTASEQGGVGRLEVSHEALICEWGRLAEWLHEAREDVRLQQTISADAAAWARRDRPADKLYRGTVLAEARDWSARNTPSAEEQAFLHAAERAEVEQAAVERDRQARGLALARVAATRLRLLAAVLALLLAVAAGLALLARYNASVASSERTREVAARDAAVAELARELGLRAGTMLGSDLQVTLLLSLEADRLSGSAEAHADLLRAIDYNPRLLSFLAAQGSPVRSVAFSPKGTLLAAGSADGTIRLWNASSRQPSGPPLAGHTGAVNGLAFSPDGRLLASGSNDGTVRLWDVAKRRLLAPSLMHQGVAVTSVAFSPDGTFLAAGDSAGSIQLWDVAGRRPLGPLPQSGIWYVYDVAFSPDGTILAACGEGGTIALWNLAHHVLLPPLRGGPSFAALSLAFSPNGRTLAAGSEAGAILLWDMATRQFSRQVISAASESVPDLAFSPDGTILAAGGQDGTIRLWDAATWQQRSPSLTGHAGAVNGLAFSPDGQSLVSAGSDGSVRLWDSLGAGAFSRVLAGHTSQVNSVAFSPDGTTLASGGDDATIRLWRVASGQPLGPPLAGQAGSVLRVAFSHDGKTLAATSAGPATGSASYALWSARSGRPLGPTLAVQSASSAAYSPDGTVLATGSGDGTVRLWDVAHRKPLGPPLAGHAGAVLSEAFSPDGKTLASGGEDGTIRLWQVPTRRPLGPPLMGYTGAVNSLAFSPDGRILASADCALWLWDVGHRRALGAPLTDGTIPLYSVAFSPDGQTLASGNSDGTIQLWDVATRQPLGPALAGHGDKVTSLAFSPDGRLLASGTGGVLDAPVRLWSIGSTSPASRACAIANRNLTTQEWKQYLGDLPYQRSCPNVP